MTDVGGACPIAATRRGWLQMRSPEDDALLSLGDISGKAGRRLRARRPNQSEVAFSSTNDQYNDEHPPEAGGCWIDCRCRYMESQLTLRAVDLWCRNKESFSTRSFVLIERENNSPRGFVVIIRPSAQLTSCDTPTADLHAMSEAGIPEAERR